MPSHLKSRVRARMAKTGERWEQALRAVRAADADAAPAPRPYTRTPSRARSVADTAFSIAVVRAEEAPLPEGERLFDDPFAAIFAAAGAHAAESTQRFLDLPFFRDGIRLRTRYIDDAIREGVARGATQVVLLGAGFDARAHRLPELAEPGVRVFEVDTAEQLARKRKLLAAAGVRARRGLAYAPCDFHADDLEGALAAALSKAGFSRERPTVFVLEGVIGYVDDAAIDATLRFMASGGASGSRAVLTYGEGSFAPDTAEERARRAGFGAVGELGGDALWRRYLPGEPHPNAWVTKVATATPAPADLPPARAPAQASKG